MDDDQKCLYHFAAKNNLLEILKEATKYDLNKRDTYGRSVIHYAALKGHLDALKLIITLG
jgi:ankyrin repeat protein